MKVPCEICWRTPEVQKVFTLQAACDVYGSTRTYFVTSGFTDLLKMKFLVCIYGNGSQLRERPPQNPECVGDGKDCDHETWAKNSES